MNGPPASRDGWLVEVKCECVHVEERRIEMRRDGGENKNTIRMYILSRLLGVVLFLFFFSLLSFFLFFFAFRFSLFCFSLSLFGSLRVSLSALLSFFSPALFRFLSSRLFYGVLDSFTSLSCPPSFSRVARVPRCRRSTVDNRYRVIVASVIAKPMND